MRTYSPCHDLNRLGYARRNEAIATDCLTHRDWLGLTRVLATNLRALAARDARAQYIDTNESLDVVPKPFTDDRSVGLTSNG